MGLGRGGIRGGRGIKASLEPAMEAFQCFYIDNNHILALLELQLYRQLNMHTAVADPTP